jgi:hypothetical protein
LYLTLAGAEGHDISLLVEEGLIRLTETGAIHESSLGAVVAIESRSEARSRLLQKFAGLEVLPDPYESLIGGNSMIRFPNGRNLDIWRSVVVNLDLNEPFEVKMVNENLEVPLLGRITKVATIQRTDAHDDGWTLLLTLHSTLLVDASEKLAVCASLESIMDSNMSAASPFADTFTELVGTSPSASHFQSVCTQRGDDDDSGTEVLRQRTLLLLVAKLIVDNSASMGWSVSLERSAYYGGGSEAAMATWVLDFRPTVKAGAANRIVASLSAFGGSAVTIGPDGTISPLPGHG